MVEELVPVEVVRSFRNLAVRHLGLDIDKEWEPLVGARILKRLKDLKIPLHRYLYRLYQETDANEIISFWDLVRPRPSAFFARWPDYVELRAQLRRGLGRGQRRFRFWSAGCGSGEEGYAMAAIAHQTAESAGVCPNRIDLKVIVTDISAKAIEVGKRGVFDMWQARQVPPELLRFFRQSSGGVSVCESIQSRVSYRCLNLAHPPFDIKGPFDAIFCREGFSTLVSDARTRALQAARQLLSEGGLLCAGVDPNASDATDAAKKAGGQQEAPRAHRAPGDC